MYYQNARAIDLIVRQAQSSWNSLAARQNKGPRSTEKIKYSAEVWAYGQAIEACLEEVACTRSPNHSCMIGAYHDEARELMAGEKEVEEVLENLRDTSQIKPRLVTDVLGYGFIITERNPEFFDEDGRDGEPIYGPRDISTGIKALLDASHGREFKMYDDDGEHYYTGRYLGPEDETMFAPLRDFGQPDGGATDIRYFTEVSEGRFDYVSL